MTRTLGPQSPQSDRSESSEDRTLGSAFTSGYMSIGVARADPYQDLDPHKYTSGRWLRRDRRECDSRYIKFDFDALRRRVIKLCPGAVSIVSYEKKEGGYNRVFVFTCDNARRIVARLPTLVAGPHRLTTNSEVATITYSESKYVL